MRLLVPLKTFAVTRPITNICDYSSHRKHLLVPQGYDLTALEPIGPLLSVDLPLTILSFLRILEVGVLLTVALLLVLIRSPCDGFSLREGTIRSDYEDDL
mgnify:CR=1 FL=1